MKKILLIVILFLPIIIYGQESKIDSLKNQLLNEKGREQIKTYLAISELPISRDSVILYLNQALKTASRIKFDSIYPIQFGLCASYYVKGDLLTAKKEIRKGFKSYKFTEDPTGTLGHINMLLGVFSEALNEVDSARYYYDKVLSDLKNKETKKSKEIISITYTNYANLYLKSGDYNKAIEIYLDSETMSKKIGDTKNQLISLNNVAGCFKEIKNYDKALKYYKEALILAEKTNDRQNIGTINLGVGEIYTLKNDYDNALVYFIRAEKILESIDFRSVLHTTYQNLAQVYLNKKNISKALIYSEKALKGVNLIKDDYSKVSILLTYVDILETVKEYKKGLQIVNDALLLAKKNSYQNLIKECLIKKIEILKKLQHHNNLAPLYDELLSLKDSLLNKKNLEIISTVEAKYQTEKKEKENLQLKAEKAEQELLLEKENKRKWYFAFGLLVSLLTLGVFGFYYRRNKKQKAVIENLQKDLHHRVKNNLAIIDSLVEDIKDEFNDTAFTLKLTDLQNRIDSINSVHQQLYMNTDITNLKIKKYVEKLSKNVQQSFAKENISINNTINDSLTLNVEQSFPIGLIINEFLTNSFKYAFTDTENGIINVDLKEKGENYLLLLSDNGKGLPNNFDISKLDSFGIDVMKLLSKQLKGTFALDGSNGVKLNIEFPKV